MTLLQKHLVFVPLFFTAYLGLFGCCVMLLWNWLIPALFGLSTITFWQAAGLLLLSKILLGGFDCGHNGHHGHGHHGCHHGCHTASGNKLRECWENMTPEERERIIEAHNSQLHDERECNHTPGTND